MNKEPVQATQLRKSRGTEGSSTLNFTSILNKGIISESERQRASQETYTTQMLHIS
jgi:hypothetical protein